MSPPVPPALPGSPAESPLDRAFSLSFAGQYEAALRWAIPVLQSDPGSPAALFLLARVLVSLKKNDLATRALGVAVERGVDASMMPLAIASASMLESLGTNASAAFDGIALAFSKSSSRFGAAAPPPLHPATLHPLADSVAGAELLKAATAVIDAAKALPRKTGTLVRQPFFSALGKAGLRSLIATLEVKSFARGEKIIEQGSTGAEAFVIVRGEVDVVREPHDEYGASINLARLSKGALFGEMALLSRAPRAAAVIAAKPVVVLVARRDELERVAEVEPEIANELAAHTRTRMLQNLVRTSAILGAIDASERPALIERFQAVSYEPGEYLVRQNQISSGLHLIASGQVSVVRTDGTEQLEIASLDVGDVVGEVSLILRRPSTADVVAKVPTVSMVLPREAFHDIIKTHPNLLAQLYDLAVKRDEETSSIVAQEGVQADDLVLVLAWRSNLSAQSKFLSRHEGKRFASERRSQMHSCQEISCSSREISVRGKPFSPGQFCVRWGSMLRRRSLRPRLHSYTSTKRDFAYFTQTSIASRQRVMSSSSDCERRATKGLCSWLNGPSDFRPTKPRRRRQGCSGKTA